MTKFASALAAAALSGASVAYACGQHDLDDPSLVRVVDASVVASKVDGQTVVSVFGTLRNTTARRVESLVVEAKLANAEGKVIDVLHQPVYGLVLPPASEVAFRIQGQAAAPQGSYSTTEVRVTSGESHAPGQQQARRESNSPWFGVLISWAPMLLLIAVWVFLAKRYSGKGSTNEKMLIAVNEQNGLIAKQVSALEALAEAVRRSKSGP